MTRTEDYDYELPVELIAQEPAAKRDESRLMVLTRDSSGIEHRHFREIGTYVGAGDVLVLNDTRVIRARLFGVRSATSGKVEGLLVEPMDGGAWRMMLKSGGKLLAEERVQWTPRRVEATLVEKAEDGTWRVDFGGVDTLELAAAYGKAPVPPYIRRATEDARSEEVDAERYQTVYAREAGAIAAPTAGLHFTKALLGELGEAGVEIVKVTLHVGLGTFLPVKTEELEEHPMHSERYHVTGEAVAALRRAREEGRRIVAVGTTSARVLESIELGQDSGEQSGRTDLFIYPPYRWRAVDALITNFHLPRSTLLALVAAFAGRERVLAAYSEAIRVGYRFYSYGDAMLIL